MENSSQSNNTPGQGEGQARPRFDWPKLRKSIEFYARERLCYLPADWAVKDPSVDGAPIKWKQFQTRLPTIAETADWFHEGRPTNIGVICGGISGGLVILAFNEQDGAREFFGEERWQKLLRATFVTKSVRGYHVWLRSDTPIESQIIGKGKNDSWLEIRSDGNFTVAPPSLHPTGVLYQAVGVDRIYKHDDLAGFITRRLVELGLQALRPKEVTGRREKHPPCLEIISQKPPLNAQAVEKLVEHCKFIKHCKDDAAALGEPHWWSECSILSFFGEPGRGKTHELSQPYPKYTEAETNKKLEYAKEAVDKNVGPHTCKFIEQNLGFSCPEDYLAKKWNLKSPVVLATRLATEGLHITIDGVTYLERLDLNRIICRIPTTKEDKPPITKTLASFIIEPKIRITLEGESERLETVLKTGNAEYPCLFRREAWNSKRQLLAALPNVDLQYYGTDKDTQATNCCLVP